MAFWDDFKSSFVSNPAVGLAGEYPYNGTIYEFPQNNPAAGLGGYVFDGTAESLLDAPQFGQPVSFGNALGGAVRKTLADLPAMLQQNRQDQYMQDLFYGNPDLATQFMGMKNQTRQTDLAAQRLIDDQMERSYQRKRERDREAAMRAAAAKMPKIGGLAGQALEAYTAADPAGGLAQVLAHTLGVESQAQKAALEEENRVRRQQETANLIRSAQGLPPLPLSSDGTGGSFDGAAAPLSVRNSNPGNMRDPATGDFVQFASPQEGLAAMQSDLSMKLSGQSPIMRERYGAGYTPTLENVISTWAPPSENDTRAYIENVSRETGISPTQPLTLADVGRIAPAMVRQEGGPQALSVFGLGSAAPVTQQPIAPPPGVAPATATTVPAQTQGLSGIDPLALAQIGAITGNDDLIQLAGMVQNQKKAQAEEQKAILERQKLEAELKAVPVEQQRKATTAESDLRKEFEGKQEVKEFRSAERAYQAIASGAKDLTGSGAIAVIFNFMKSLDPTSTVREGEYATAKNAGGIPTWLSNIYNQSIDGNGLTPEMRDQFLETARQQYIAQENLFNETALQYIDLSKSYGYNPANVVKGARLKVPAFPTKVPRAFEEPQKPKGIRGVRVKG